jgi:hypothetical protein
MQKFGTYDNRIYKKKYGVWAGICIGRLVSSCFHSNLGILAFIVK